MVEEPVALDRRERGGVVQRGPGRREMRQLARVAGDARGLPRPVDVLDELDGPASGSARDGTGGAVRRAAEEVRQLLVEERRPVAGERRERGVAHEDVRLVRPDAFASREAGAAPHEVRRTPAGARGQRDQPAGIPLGPLGGGLPDRGEVGGRPRPLEVLPLEQRQRPDAVRRAGERRLLLPPARRERLGGVGEAADLVPGPANRRVGVAGEDRQDLDGLAAVEERRAGERGVVEVRFQDQERRLREAALLQGGQICVTPRLGRGVSGTGSPARIAAGASVVR